ncbi:MAG: CHAD domain-containing protein [Chloroflexota bacterium]
MSTYSADQAGEPSPSTEPTPDRTPISAEPRFSEPRPLRPVGPGRHVEPALVPSAEAASTALRAADHLALARTPEVAADDVWVEAGRKVLRFHLGRMLARVPGTIDGEDPEEVHAMRVASRRLRAGWRVFGDAFERPVVRDRVAQLRVLGAELGMVRDLDVQIGILLASRDRHSKRGRLALAPLVDTWTAERAARHHALVVRLRSPWFTTFVADHDRLVTTEGEAARAIGPHAPATVRMRAPAVAWQSYQAVWAFEPALISPDVATLHELRISTKWLRYTLESVREPMEPSATELIRRVVALQDQLGDIHDLHAAAERARASAVTIPDLRTGQRTAIERFAADKDVRVDRLMRRLGPTWRGVADPEYRRRLGQSLARL